ncbi:hypothetical protein FIBSPDRAFT_849641 [Athelia psychrophila]|uniref:Uncharacterized protein n=1 Tax=Athelia psychrophila TaxID=1759441 RepID=A0A166TYU4_9AGAM|nr:hypothetical protein FIBSPDRAFT_849641 [Fibularhizoctonia sp. CBS 109695]
MVDAECAQLREMLGRKVDMVGHKSSEAAQSTSMESIVAPSDDTSSLASIIDANGKDKGPISLKSAGLKASRHRDMPAERDVLCLMKSLRALVQKKRRHGYKICGRCDERVCSPTEKEVLEMMGFPRRTKKDATPRCNKEPAKIKECDTQIGAQASVSVGGRSSARGQRLSEGTGGAQAPTHLTVAHQEPIVERCDAGNSATIGVGVKTDTSPPRTSAKDTNILRSVLSSTNGHRICPLRRVPPLHHPPMSPFIRKAVEAMKEWDADIAEDPFWAQV